MRLNNLTKKLQINIKILPLALIPFLQLARLDSAQALKSASKQTDREQITNNIRNYFAESTNSRYGAIVIDKKKRFIGWSIDHESEQRAKVEAILACPNSCYGEVITFKLFIGGFFSLATGDYIEGHTEKAWGIASSFDLDATASLALSDCRLRSCQTRIILGANGVSLTPFIYGGSESLGRNARKGYN